MFITSKFSRTRVSLVFNTTYVGDNVSVVLKSQHPDDIAHMISTGKIERARIDEHRVTVFSAREPKNVEDINRRLA